MRHNGEELFKEQEELGILKESAARREQTEWGPISARRICRAMIRWEDDVRADLGKTKKQNGSKTAMDRKE
jgi:hypothetical protein